MTKHTLTRSQRARAMFRDGATVRQVVEALGIDPSWARRIRREMLGVPRGELIRIPYQTKLDILALRSSGRTVLSVARQFHVSCDFVSRLWRELRLPTIPSWRTFVDDDGQDSPTPATIQARAFGLRLWKLDHGLS